jgi:hypothetical protein
MTTNPYMALFAGPAPCLIAPEMQPVFETCLTMLHETFDEPKARTQAATSSSFWPDDPDSYLAMIRPYQVNDDGILTIPVQGVLLSNFPYSFQWATGYDYILQAMIRGMADYAVRGIALAVNSTWSTRYSTCVGPSRSGPMRPTECTRRPTPSAARPTASPSPAAAASARSASCRGTRMSARR